MEKEIRISNNLNEIATLANFIEELGEELSLPMEAIMNIWHWKKLLPILLCMPTLPRRSISFY